MQLNTHHRHWLNKRGITDAVLEDFNITTDHHPTIGDCIRIPVQNATTPFAKYRRDPLDERKPKYVYDQGGKVTLYGQDKVRSLPSNPAVVITEGELDALVLWSLNIPAVSSTGGAMSFQEEWVKDTFFMRDVYLCFDQDEAGAEGMVRVLKHLPHAKVILLPNLTGVKDISDYVSHGYNFRALMETATHYTSLADVEEDKRKRDAIMLPTIFHDKYIDANKPQSLPQDTTGKVQRKDISNEVARAKAYPMNELIAFKKNQAICPWHNEKTPSLHYYEKTNSAYCFGSCGRAYDSIDFVMLKYNLSFPDAVEFINKLP